MFMKHDPALRDVIPFGTDPYDAVGSFAVIVGLLLALLSLLRAFRPYWTHPPSPDQQFYLVRTQMAVVLAVLITLVADAVAMARHTSVWVQAGSRTELLILLAGMAVITLTVGALVRASMAGDVRSTSMGRTYAAVISLACLFILAVYPEQLIENTATHLLTVVAGALLLFAPLRALLIALAPAGGQPVANAAAYRGSVYGWGLVTLAGMGIGAFLVVAEMTQGGGPLPGIGQLLFVAGVFVGLTTAGLLVAYCVCARPAGIVATVT